jgi:PGF-pre-PGF domain-containing protein
LVLSTASDKGRARVEGWELTSSIDLGGISLGVILADNVSFTKDGQPVSLQQILANPNQYNLQLVKVSAMRRQVSILFDLGQIKVPLTVGYLTDSSRPLTQLVRGAIDRGKDLIQNPDPSFVKSLLGLGETRVGVFDFETDYWTDAQAETNGIVLSSGSVIQTLKSIFSGASNLMQLDQNIPVIYDVKTELSYTSVSSVEEITSNLAQYRDKVVGLTVNAFGGRLSIQEAIKKAGVAIPVDVCVEGSVNWNNLSIPPEMNQILLAIGASNDSQDKIANQFNGRYFVVGRIVTTKQIDESWPEYPLLLIYDKERVGDINWAGLADPIKTFVENQVGKLYWTLSGFSTEPISGITVVPPEGISVLESSLQIPEIVFVPEKIELLLRTVAPETPLELRLENTEISKIMIKLKKIVENVSVSFKKIAREEVSVPNPPENLFPGVYSYFEARFKAPAEAVDEAEISFFVLKEWLATRGASKDDVRLLRYHDGTWESLVTNFENENQTHFMYTAKTPGFSVFSVAIYKPTVAPPTGEEEPAREVPINLLVILIVIVAVVGVGVLSYRRRKRSGSSVAPPVAGEEKPAAPSSSEMGERQRSTP